MISYILIIVGVFLFLIGIVAAIRRLLALKKGIYKPIFKWLPFFSLFSRGRIVIASDNPSYYPKVPGTVINFTKEDTKKLKEKYTSQSWLEAFTSILKGGSAKESVHPNTFKFMMIMGAFFNLVIAGIGVWLILKGIINL